MEMQPITRILETRAITNELQADFICYKNSQTLQRRMDSSWPSRVSPDPDVEGVDLRSAKVSNQDREVSCFFSRRIVETFPAQPYPKGSCIAVVSTCHAKDCPATIGYHATIHAVLVTVST
eukprot:488056-Amphidinium_carterae.1